MSDRPVHIVVVAYHAPLQLAHCLGVLQRALPVTVIDNSSSADISAVARKYGATYVDCGRNLGFAAGVNVALARLENEAGDVLLLNPDAAVDADGVRELVRFLHGPANNRVAAVAPRLQLPGEPEQRVVWPLPTPTRMCAEALGLGRLLPSRRRFVVGAVLLLRREAINEIGRFDERFFLYAEEADWQRRARERGWSAAVCAAVVAEHAGAGASANARRREELFHASQETYIRKWYGRRGWWLYRSAACCGAAARAIVLTRERRRDATRRMLLYLRGPRRCAALGAE